MENWRKNAEDANAKHFLLLNL